MIQTIRLAQLSTFLAVICISLVDYFAPIDTQGPGCAHLNPYCSHWQHYSAPEHKRASVQLQPCVTSTTEDS